MEILSDPRHYDYSGPTRTCDVVMKGGITSGVVYPHAICELARAYRFTSIGGTSAGAIAAAAGAAAEYGREAGGFVKLAALPEWLGTGSNLRGLFQPQRGTRPLFRVLMAAVRVKAPRSVVLGVALAAVRAFPLAPVLGSLPGIAIFAVAAFAPGGGWIKAAGLLAGGALALLGAALGLLIRVGTDGPRQISANGFGLCSGMPAGTGDAPAITPWLADTIDEIAGRSDEKPLTFGDLQERGIELAMMTTNLTQRQSHRLPFAERVFFFDPEEWRRLFPERIVKWMIDHPAALPPAGAEDTARIRQVMLPRRPLPSGADLPVVVAARMSLSFPILVSAIPLWAFDRTLKRNNEALRDGSPPGARAEPERCWFSDGGISSNFPVHFFDTALPTRPTFAIDLDAFHNDYPKSANEADNVYLPESNVGGLLEAWYRFPEEPGIGRFAAFLEGVVRTMQNRVDSALARQPGYRDRIVHVHTDASEGGMNLAMPPLVIKALTLRGQAAARLLVRRFAETPGTSPGPSWDNHRWIRYRSSVAALGELLKEAAGAWSDRPPGGERTYQELAVRGNAVGPNAYRFGRAAQRELALEMTDRLIAAGMALAASSEDLDEQAPRPLVRARIAPRN